MYWSNAGATTLATPVVALISDFTSDIYLISFILSKGLMNTSLCAYMLNWNWGFNGNENIAAHVSDNNIVFVYVIHKHL